MKNQVKILFLKIFFIFLLNLIKPLRDSTLVIPEVRRVVVERHLRVCGHAEQYYNYLVH